MPNLKNNKNEMLENVSLKRINKGIFLNFKGNKKKIFLRAKLHPKKLQNLQRKNKYLV